MEFDAVLADVHRLGPRWAERAHAADAAGAIGADTAKELSSIDAQRFIQPREFGGAELSIEAHMRIVAAAGEYCSATSWCLAVWSAHNWMAAHFPIEGQRELWANPSALLSASIVPKTPFETRGDDLVVQGRFPFASGCDHADWLGVGGLIEGAGPVIALFPADEPGVEIDHDSWDVVGLRGTGSKDLVVDEPLVIPGHRVLRQIEAGQRNAPGQRHHDSALYRNPFRATACIVLAAPVLGAAISAVRRFTERLDGHVILAAGGNQRSDPAAGARLAEASAEAEAAQLIGFEAAARLDALGHDAEPDPERVGSIFRDTAFAVRMAARAVDRLYEASGGSALQRSEPIQRVWRDVHAARSHAILTWDGAASTYAASALGGS